MTQPELHVFIGTKAQYIKTAPLLWLMDERGVDYRLVDSGQHAVLGDSFRKEMGIRPPDVRLGRGADVASIPQALVWTVRLAGSLVSKGRLRATVFGGRGGVCVVHGDTPSTLLSMVMARRAGLAVAHLEAGLRSGRWLHPFPEEIIRFLVARRADLLFAPDEEAVRNLEAMDVKGEIVALPGNTVLEALRRSDPVGQADGPVIITMHRVENLHRRSRREGLASLAEQLATDRAVRWLLHQPTASALGKATMDRLTRAGVELGELVGHSEFLGMLGAAPFVITDGGSIQEECAMLGVPTLLWRKRTDRPDGLGENVVLSCYDRSIISDFVSDPDRFRHPVRVPEVSPSEQILEALCGWR
ncbi:MAG: UDP-N-acetylglucosamine 2-epimerase [bacterium]|nr:UDP-N-acetylglucosamine 2-epimerase [bacterium]MDE0287541.1 UDP-N-acetylglucosamine 2-epimerase [bacterium]MDE0440354.1 UDP-N-acetylglucosamine 2-epimerase [bacterium]